MEKQIQKNQTKLSSDGSALVVTMIILGIILVSTLSISLVAVQERKSSIGENRSNQAYQIADTGVEKVMQAIKNNTTGTVADIDGADDACDGIIKNSTEGYTVQLKDASDNPITSCAAKIASIKSIKSIGTAGGNQRAIEVAVAAGECLDGQTTFVVTESSDSSYDAADKARIFNFINRGGLLAGVSFTISVLDYNITNGTANCVSYCQSFGLSTSTTGVPSAGIGLTCNEAGSCTSPIGNVSRWKVIGFCDKDAM